MTRGDHAYHKKRPFISLVAVFTVFCIVLPAGSLHAANPDPDQNQSNNTKVVIVGNMVFHGNKVTHESIIFREILFRQGDTLLLEKFQELLEQSRQNLLNTSLFNFVEIDTSFRKAPITIADINFTFTERWYIWPVPVLEMGDRNFNEWWQTRDFRRLNYGFLINHNNFRGRRELLQVQMLLGYSQSLLLSYVNPNVNPSKTAGFGLTFIYGRKHELAWATKNDKLAYYDNPSEYSIQSYIAAAMFYYRPHIHQSHSFWLQYSHHRVSDTILRLNPEFFPGLETDPRFFSFIYEFRSDHRNLKYYPTKGYYFDLLLTKHGLGVLQNSKINTMNVNTNYKKYMQLGRQWFLLAGTGVKLSLSGRQPYLMSPSLGYMYDFVRGYEYYVIDGRHTFLFKTNLKYRLLAPRTFIIPFIRTEKFRKLHLSLYLGIHNDLGYVYEPDVNRFNNRLPNTLLWGKGAGFDVVTYYDRVLRIEYSLNRFGEHGFFMHFLAPI